METSNNTTCKICGKTGMKRLGFHLRKMHQLSVKEYEAIKPAVKGEPKDERVELSIWRVFQFIRQLERRMRPGHARINNVHAPHA